jgi:hypothetical protein
MTRILFSLVLCGTLLGCAHEPTGAEWVQAHGEMTDRLLVARAIGDNTKRDVALFRLATDATKNKDASIALEAVEVISDTAKRDRKAKECAIAFHKHGDRDSAKRFVELIGSNRMRDELNERLAR